MEKIRVLVVDDSILFREVLTRGISSDPCIEVVAKASDPYDARDKIICYEPDVMTCDVEMPKMNGIEFVKKLLPQYPIPVVMVSSISEAVFEAMKAGVVDFVTKPDVQSPKSVENFIKELIIKIKIAATAKVLKHQSYEGISSVVKNTSNEYSKKIIAIGASTGGTEAAYNLIKRLPPTIPGIVLVQHIPPVFSRMFAERLNNTTSLRVKEAESGDVVEEGLVLVAPGDKHMRIKRVGSKYKVDCFSGERVNGHCPSVDVLFESVAKEANKDALGIILTGMGYDGAKGLMAMRRKGARTIGQDESTSVVYGMPKVAFEVGAVEKQAPLHNIHNLIFKMLK